MRNNKNLAYAFEFCRTRQDAPCKHCMIYTHCVIFNTNDSNNVSNKDKLILRRSLRKKS